MTIPYQKFLSLSPTLHQLCSSDFVSERWLLIMMSIKRQTRPIDWRQEAGSQFQLLSDLCQLANKTIEDAIRRFMMQSFVTSHVLAELDFNTELNTTVNHFFQSTTFYFGQLVNTVHLLMQVDQPFIQSESLIDGGLLNVHNSVETNKTTGNERWRVSSSFELTNDEI